MLEWPLLLGGSAKPLGGSVSFLDREAEEVADDLVAWRRELTAERGRAPAVVERGLDLESALAALDPMESPWTVEVLVRCGSWTAYLNNSIGSGDQTGAPAALAARLGCRRVVAEHVARFGPGHASTQLWIEDPVRDGPARTTRSLAAHATDGRWVWHTAGDVQPWERPERYEASRVRDRLDRPLLIEYLRALGIRPDDPWFYGLGAVARTQAAWPRRTVSVGDWIAESGWA